MLLLDNRTMVVIKMTTVRRMTTTMANTMMTMRLQERTPLQ